MRRSFRAATALSTVGWGVVARSFTAEYDNASRSDPFTAGSQPDISRAAMLDRKWLAEEVLPGYLPPDASWPQPSERPRRADIPHLRVEFARCVSLECGSQCSSLGALLGFGLLGGVLFGHQMVHDNDDNETSTPDTDAASEMMYEQASEGFRLLRVLADAGSAEAACGVGMCLLYGHGGQEEDDAQALHYFTRSAEAGYEHAQHALGCAFYLGEGTSVDYAQAVLWFKRAAAQGHPNAMFLLGECLLEGIGVSPDRAAAFQWFFAAGERGHVGARARVRTELLGMPNRHSSGVRLTS
mmetsp:Transcript_46263/g.76519  ORF Transcript_46263/g.76519 Transcript_46263/m.76519 type:complete len:298 (-) Transcript_46263:54-947(-)